ncbi:MAG: hypothetical protein ACYC5X_13570 [Syntrophales bacterium]
MVTLLKNPAARKECGVFLIIMTILVTPFLTYAGTVYRCTDKKGSVYISDYPLDGKICTASGAFKEMTVDEKINSEKEKAEKEKRLAEEYEKANTSEEQKRKALADLEKCYEEARLRHITCQENIAGVLDQSVWNAAMIRCDYTHQQERNQCVQQNSQNP